MAVCHWQITSQELLTDPDCAPESAKSVSTSWTGSRLSGGVINLRENPSTISSLVLLLGLISRFPANELRVAIIAQKTPPNRLRFSYDVQECHRNLVRIGEFVAKVLNSSKLLSQIPDRPTNCKN